MYNEVISAMHGMVAAISQCYHERMEKKEIIDLLYEPRLIHSRSPFINRLQNWPYGYQGDYETIEYICSGKNKVSDYSVEYYLEWYALNSAIAQQHRNKVNIQAKYMINQIVEKSTSKILIIGCGNGYDIRAVQNIIKRSKSEIYLNDIDINAIDFTKNKLDSSTLDHCYFIHENILKLVKNKQLINLKFDMIMFGGVFDYLSDKSVIFLLKNMYKNYLNDSGKILFTNINKGNPFKYWLEYLADWILIERSIYDCYDICIKSNIHGENLKIYSEETGLALITEINKEINE